MVRLWHLSAVTVVNGALQLLREELTRCDGTRAIWFNPTILLRTPSAGCNAPLRNANVPETLMPPINSVSSLLTVFPAPNFTARVPGDSYRSGTCRRVRGY